MQQKPFTYALVCVLNIYGGKCQRHDYAIPNLTLGSVTGAVGGSHAHTHTAAVCDSPSHTHTHNYCSSRAMTSSHELTTRHK